MKRFLTTLAVLALVAGLCLPTLAQESAVKGNLGGVVHDISGAVVQGAKVTLTGPMGTKTVTSDAQGDFMFSLMQPGTYTLVVEKQGFRKAELKAVEVFVGKTSSIKFALQPGAVSETVEVSANALSVDTVSTSVSSNLNDTLFHSVPVASGVQNLFYAAPGVVSGGATGSYNPSIAGGSGLENSYVADGVNMTDAAYGGFGVYSISAGSLGSGITTSFVKEVQVKTGGLEPQYGQSTGGVIQIVTKSGGTAYHGGFGGNFQPGAFEATRLQADDTGRFNQTGKILNQANWNISGEIGGPVPGLKDKLFFFGSFDPNWNINQDKYANMHGILPFTVLPDRDATTVSYNYAAKLTYKINDRHQLESSVFGDPSRQNNVPATLRTFNHLADQNLAYANRNWAVRYNGTLSPTWLANASWAWKSNYVQTTALHDIYQVTNNFSSGIQGYDSGTGLLKGDVYTTGMSGAYQFNGPGYQVDANNETYSWTLDTQKVVKFLGEHTLSLGYHGEHSIYSGLRKRSGGLFQMPPGMEAAIDSDVAGPGPYFDDATFDIRLVSSAQQLVAAFNPLQPLVGANGNLFKLTSTGVPCSIYPAAPDFNADCLNPALRTNISTSYPLTFVPGIGWRHVRMRQTRGDFHPPAFNTSGIYHSLYGNDSWSPSKYLTLNLGLRWEQWLMQGRAAKYTFTDNWSPRIGVSVDPWGDRKSKAYVNFGRYGYKTPLDMANRSLSAEFSAYAGYWVAANSGTDPAACAAAVANGLPAGYPCGTSGTNGVLSINADGSVPMPALTAANYIGSTSTSLQAKVPFAPGTKMMYLDEWVVGFERDMGQGVMFSARYMDRRLKRALEDMAALSPESFGAYNMVQQYLIGNPGPKTDFFTNVQQIPFAPIVAGYDAWGVPFYTNQPAACGTDNWNAALVNDTYGNPIAPGAVCVVPGPYANGAGPGDSVPDGKVDGFPAVVRNYQAVEVEVNKAFSNGWQLRTNYRYAKLKGNWEGAFRNDNGQSDPNISSLFDFTAGNFGMLGDQFAIGYLNTDRRHVVNGFFSYTFGKYAVKGLTIGTGLHLQSGQPINDLKAHPAYLNGGEIPAHGRGALGRYPTTAQIDMHSDYVLGVTEKHKLRFAVDMFNIVNMKRVTGLNEFEDNSFGVPNVDFQTVSAYQRPFYARFGVRWEF